MKSVRRFGKTFKKLDVFPDSAKFTIKDGETGYQTKMGAFFSLMMMTSVMVFGISRLIQLV